MFHPNKPKRQQGLAFLCLDGGGVRGLSSLYILKQLMETISIRNPPKPCDYFDMIGGTSTGGLIAIMLGRLQMSVDECIEAYKVLSSRIFTKMKHRLSLRGKVQGRFDHAEMERAMKELLKSGGLREDEPFRYNSPEDCKTFVCTTSKQTGATVILSSYLSERRGRGLYDVTTIWQAARATSAASSFFEPIEIGGETFVDGATPANNPIMELWSEAIDVFSDSEDSIWRLEDNVSCIISIGTGTPSLRPFGNDPFQIGARLVKMSMDTERRAEEFARHHYQLCREGIYFRFNVNRGLQGIGLEEESKLKDIIGATRLYLQSEEVHRRLLQCSVRLDNREKYSKNIAFSREVRERSEIRALRTSSEELAVRFDVRPTSEILAWFTNTAPYRDWVTSEGGCLYYPKTRLTTESYGRLLVGALPASWKTYPPPTEDKFPDVRVAFVNCEGVDIREIEDVVRLLVSQTLIMFYPNEDAWQTLIHSLGLVERRVMAQNLQTATFNALYDILNSVLSNSRVAAGKLTQVKVLLVIANIHLLNAEDPDTVQRLLQLRATAERLQIHILVTGEEKLCGDGRGWGATEFPRVDENTEYKECLKSLQFDDMYTRRNQVCVAFDGTAKWIQSHPRFLAWSRRQSGVLWVQGKPGSGKSVLAKSILSSSIGETSTLTASWFYSKRGGTVGMSHISMMRSICYQLLSQSQEIFKACSGLFRQKAFDQGVFTSFMKLFITGNDLSPVFCVLDGLDESAERDEKSGRAILEHFAELTERPGSQLKVIVLSRPYRSIEHIFGTYDILLEAENADDIEKIVDRGLSFISKVLTQNETETLSSFAKKRRERLEGCPTSRSTSGDVSSPKIQVSQQDEIDAIKSYLLANARGVMLWVTLSIDQAIRYTRKGPVTWTMLHKMLAGLPLELYELYHAITVDLAHDCTPEHGKMGRKALAWVMAASTKRPLLVKELFDAMSIPDNWPESMDHDPNTDFLQKNRLLLTSWSRFCRSIHDICGSLIEFVNPSQSGSFLYDRLSRVTGRSVVQLVHQTAKEYLEGGRANLFAFKPTEADKLIIKEADFYLRMAVPLHWTSYAPPLDDIADDWKAMAVQTLHYLDNKYLIPFILSHCWVNEEYFEMAISGNSKWMLSPFYNTMAYKDIEWAGVIDETVVGWCFKVVCRLGLQTAVDNLLYLTSLRPGWWVIHREAVLEAALQVAREHGIEEMVPLLSTYRDKYDQPALQHYSTSDCSAALLRASRMSKRPRGVYGKSHVPSMSTQEYHGLPRASKSSIEEAIRRILHYLTGNMQPLGLRSGTSWNSRDSSTSPGVARTSERQSTLRGARSSSLKKNPYTAQWI